MSILKNINYIQELDRIPCAQPDILIIIETAFKSAPPALLTLFTPGCTDIVKTRIGNSPWHLKKVSSLIKGAISPYPLSEQKFLYRIGYYTAEKYLWWWMVADVTTEFVTTWQSMIYQEQQCQLPGAGTAYGYFEPTAYPPDFTGGTFATPIKLVPGVAPLGGGIAIAPGLEASVAGWVQWESWPTRGLAVSVDFWMTKDDDDTPISLTKTNAPGDKNWNYTPFHLYHKDLNAIVPTKYRWWAKNTGDNYAQAVNTSWNAGLRGRKQGNLTWGCKLKPVEWPFPNPLENWL